MKVTTIESGTDRRDADALVEDVGELYRSLSKSLERIVQFGVCAPDPVIEEACQVAWSRLVYHRQRVRRETALRWLASTAIHEAYKLLRRRDRELPLEAAEVQTELRRPAPVPGPAELLEQRDRLSALCTLPRRQQRILWLRGLGLSYDEIALRDGCTTRTVERQLRRARTTLRAAEG
jgi:RNA polymerase sigma factor (sigma-70 family)